MRNRLSVWLRHNSLNIVVLLMSLTLALAVYALIEVENQRSASILRECRDQNARHTATVDELNREMGIYIRKASPAKRAQLKQSEGFTILLIDALAPYENCQHVLAKTTLTH